MAASVGQGQDVRTLERRVETDLGRPFAHLVWTRYWATFAERSRVAASFGCPLAELDAAIERHPWQLQQPPALELGETDLSGAVPFGGGSRMTVAADDFVSDARGDVPPVATHVTINADDSTLRVEIRCAEPAMGQLLVRATEPADAFERAVLDGDVYALYRLRPKLKVKDKNAELIERALAVPQRTWSVYEDDCVFVRLTPLAVGENLSREFLVRDQRDPAGLLRESGSPKPGQLQLTGSFYTVAVNAKGVVHSSFFDPYDTGRFWGCWDPLAKVQHRRGSDDWSVSLTIPLPVLEPQLSRGAVWGVDVYRHRPPRQGTADTLMRTRRTTLLCFKGDGRHVERDLRLTRPFDEAVAGKWPAMWERTEVPVPEGGTALLKRDLSTDQWPTRAEWDQAGTLTPFRDYRTGQTSAVQTRARVLQAAEELLIRFDCDEPDKTPLRVVTRKQEAAAFPKGHRAISWLDRREHFGGPKWGDYIEVQLAPGLAGADRYHNGYYLLLLNSRGDVLERYYDPFGMGTADANVADWDSRARTRVKITDMGWCVELAVPWSSFHGLDGTGAVWFANFRRERASGRERGATQQSAWAVPYCTKRDPGYYGRIRLAAKPSTKKAGPNVPQFWPGEFEPDPLAVDCDRSRDCLTGLAVLDDGKRLVATGARGTVWRSGEDGTTGARSYAGAEFNLQRVQFANATQGWAVGGWVRDKRVAICGGMGIILTTADGGRTWQTQWRGKGPWFYDLCFVSPAVGYVCGGYGVVLKTTDGGRTWHGALATGTNDWLHGIHFVDERRGWAVGANETVLHTRDGGQTWQRQTADNWRRPGFVRERLRAVTFVDPERGWAVGGHGTILHTSDGGKHWQRQKLPLDDETADLLELRDVHFVDSQAGWAVGEIGSVVLRTEDGGRNWKLAPTGFRGGLFGVRAADRQHVWAVGEKGARLASFDGGETWAINAAAEQPAWLYITPHDHHLNAWSSLIATTADTVDWTTVSFGRGGFYFEPHMGYQGQRWTAGTQSIGAIAGRVRRDSMGSRRRRPHFVHHAYQIEGGTEPLTRRLVALFRLLRPEVIFTEFPIFAEGYWAWETAFVPRCARLAAVAAGDPGCFPELSELGLEPWQPTELYSSPSWANEIYGMGVTTHTLRLAKDAPSPRFGRSRLDAVRRSMAAWEGLMDRGTPDRRVWWRKTLDLHLVHRLRDSQGLSRPIEGLAIE
jgi:photosystem II stability/assembly factor-like uncharacterized protein